MNIKLLFTLLTFMVSSFFNVAYANEESLLDCELKQEKRVALFYANGMLNNIDDRVLSSKKSYYRLKKLYDSGKINNVTKDDFKYVKRLLSINKSETKETSNESDPWYKKWTLIIWGTAKEIIEVIFDYGQEVPFAAINFLALDGKVSTWIDENWVDDSSTAKNIKSFYNQIMTSVSEFTDEDLFEQVHQYKTYMNDGYKVVVIAHSHGNLISRKAIELLNLTKEDKESFKVISVGSPISMSGFAEVEVIAEGDNVTKLSGIFRDDYKVRNESVYNSESGKYSMHSYLSYLYGSASSDVINNFFINSIKNFNFTDSLFGKDLITLELDKSFSKNQNLKLHVVESSNLLNNNENYYIGNDAEKASTDIGDSLIYGSGYGKFSSDNNSDKYTLSCDAIKNIAGDNDLGNGSIFTVNAYITNFNESKVSTKLTYTAPIVNTSGESKVSAYYDVYPDGNGNYNDSHDNYGYIHIYSSYGEKINYINRLNRSNIEPYEVK